MSKSNCPVTFPVVEKNSNVFILNTHIEQRDGNFLEEPEIASCLLILLGAYCQICMRLALWWKEVLSVLSVL